MNLTRRQLGCAALLGVAESASKGRVAFGQNKTFQLRFGTSFLTMHPAAVRMTEACDAIRQETGGAVDIQMFPNGQLGSESAMESQVRSGALDFMMTSGVVMQTFAPAAGISGVPFVFKDYAAVWPAMDGELGGLIREAVAKARLYVFEKSVDNGFRNITTSSRPINAVGDLKGLKIRVPVTPLWVSMFKALGAAPVSINLPELYSALQTKIVDAQENPLVQIDTFRMYEVQKYCSLTGHVWDGNWVTANGRQWAELPNDVQMVISRHFNSAALKQREENARLNADLEKSLAEKGLVFNTPEKDPFRESLIKAGFYTEWKKKYGPELWDALERAAGTQLG